MHCHSLFIGPLHVGIETLSYEQAHLSNDSVFIWCSNHAAIPSIRSVSMRDTGTEMTPMTSQEPSRTGTPIGSTTPIRSPVSSLPSTPRGEPAPSPAMVATENELEHQEELKKKELSEKEQQLKTRREIVALGMQLGKMNIAAWASKEEKENADTSLETLEAEHLQKIEYEARAAAWEEAEKSKHTARLFHYLLECPFYHHYFSFGNVCVFMFHE